MKSTKYYMNWVLWVPSSGKIGKCLGYRNQIWKSRHNVSLQNICFLLFSFVHLCSVLNFITFVQCSPLIVLEVIRQPSFPLLCSHPHEKPGRLVDRTKRRSQCQLIISEDFNPQGANSNKCNRFEYAPMKLILCISFLVKDIFCVSSIFIRNQVLCFPVKDALCVSS